MEGNYVQYKLSGFSGLELKENEPCEIENNPYVKSVELNNDLTAVTINLRDGVDFEENKGNIELFLKELIFNLIIKTEADVEHPNWSIEYVRNGNMITVNEHIFIHDAVTVLRLVRANSVYSSILDSPTAIVNKQLLYERIFCILQNPNLVVQFMSLYEILSEMVQKIIKNGEGQEKVGNYFKSTMGKYSFIVKFYPSTKPGKNGKSEDLFTYTRNAIAHCEDKNDLNEYKRIGSQVTSKMIKDLLLVLNDVIMDLPEE